MTDPRFFRQRKPLSIAEIVLLTGAEIASGDHNRTISGVRPLDLAGPDDLTFCDSPKFRGDFKTTNAGVCFTRAEFAADAPSGIAVLIVKDPFRAYVIVSRTLYADDLKPVGLFGAKGIASGASVHPEAKLEDGVVADPGAVIGPRAEIGEGTLIGANAVIGADVRIGRNCVISPNVTIQHALIGDRVVIHPGAQIGQDGFGYVPGKGGMMKVPQIGRVIIQDDVEIGASTTVDRGAHRDTMIGEGTKIDNLVQIAHNVSIGRHCVIAGQVGITGSCTIGDFVMMGGNVGLANGVNVGDGAQLAARSGVIHDVPAGGKWGGAPAVPIRQFLREIAAIKKLAETKDSEKTK